MRYVALVLMLSLSFISVCSFGQDINFSSEIYFDENDSTFDTKRNEIFIDSLSKILEKIATSTEYTLLKIEISAFSHPDGGINKSKLRCSQRIESIEKFLNSNYVIPVDIITKKNQGVAWSKLRELVLAELDELHRSDVIDIIDNTPEETYQGALLVGSRNHQLMEIEAGRSYVYMRENFFEKLDETVVTIHYKYKLDIDREDESNADSAVLEYFEIETIVDSSTVQNVAELEIIIDSTRQPSFEQTFYVGTNILYSLLMPNVKVEYRFLPQWSLGLGISAPWWNTDEMRYRVQLYEIEGEYYLEHKPRHHFGVSLLSGLYDLKDGEIGRLGSFGGFSLGYSYTVPLSDVWKLDFGFDYGYIYTKDVLYKYNESAGHHDYAGAERSHLFIPTKIGVSLIWKMNSLLRKGDQK